MNDSCDLKAGICESEPFENDGDAKNLDAVAALEVVYVGDPMCSWCWGISPALKQLQAHCFDRGIPFSIVVGGLRPGGGDEWNQQFRDFLRHHWQEIGRRTGQPFHFDLLKQTYFDYDTEPSCRAVVAARKLLPLLNVRSYSLYDFFAAIQRKFYVENEDPKELEFYRDICVEAGVSFPLFSEWFEGSEVKNRTRQEFQLNREWGVRGYPSVLVGKNGKLSVIASGFTTGRSLIERVSGNSGA